MTYSYRSRTRTRALLLCGYLALAALWYWPTRRAGWVTDILGLLPRLSGDVGIGGAWTGFGSPVFHPLTLAGHYLLYDLGGAQSLLHYGVWVGLHAATAWLLAVGLEIALRDAGLSHGRTAGMLAGAVFMVHPYVAEVIVWRATFNYLLCSPLMLTSAGCAYAYAKTGRPNLLIAVAGATALALLSFDLAWVAPILVACAAAAAAPTGRLGGGSLRRVGMAAVVAVCTFAAYLAIKTSVIGTAVGHYGAETHLRFDLATVLPNAWRSLFKLFFLTREYSFGVKSAYHRFISESYVYVPLSVAGCSALAYWWRVLRRRSARWRLAGWIGIGTLAAIAPTANLFFYWLQRAEGDRYGYLATAGIAAVLAVGWSAIPRSGLRLALAVGYLLVLGFFGRRQLRAWAEGEYAQRLLIANWPLDDHEPAIVLAAADNYRGTYLFRDNTWPYQSVDYNLRLLGGRAPRDSVLSLVGYNQLTLADSVLARIDEHGAIELTFGQWGNWFWREGIGLTDYRRPGVRVTAGYPAKVCFTRPLAPGTALLYPVGTTWARLDASTLRRCEAIDSSRAVAK